MRKSGISLRVRVIRDGEFNDIVRLAGSSPATSSKNPAEYPHLGQSIIGYNGAPRGFENCCDIGTCPRIERNMHQGEGYGICRAVHAEENALSEVSFSIDA